MMQIYIKIAWLNYHALRSHLHFRGAQNSEFYEFKKQSDLFVKLTGKTRF